MPDMTKFYVKIIAPICSSGATSSRKLLSPLSELDILDTAYHCHSQS